MPLRIIKYPDPILRKKTKKIKDPLSPEIKKLIPKMIEIMRKNNGLGLAAPQVGKSVRLCIIEDYSPDQKEKELYVLINPVIKSHSRNKITMEEGCLSFPGKFLNIKRAEKIKVRYLDKNGKKVKMKADGVLARAFQHEIDHLDGVLFIDKVKQK